MDNTEINSHAINQALMHFKILISRCETLSFSDMTERDLYLEKAREALKTFEEALAKKAAK